MPVGTAQIRRMVVVRCWLAHVQPMRRAMLLKRPPRKRLSRPPMQVSVIRVKISFTWNFLYPHPAKLFFVTCVFDCGFYLRLVDNDFRQFVED